MSARHRWRQGVVLATLAAAAGPACSGTLLSYVANSNDDSISVFDVDASLPVDTFAVGDRPVDVVVSADHAFLFVSRVDGMVEQRSRSDGALLTAVAAGIQAQELLLSAAGDRLYVAGADALGGAVIVLASADLSPAARIALPGTGFGLALSPDGDRLYASSPSDNSIAVVDTATDTLVDTVVVGLNPQGVAVAADGARVHTGTTDTMGVAGVSVVDVASAALIDEISFGNASLTFPFFIALSSARAYVSVGYIGPGPFQALA